MHDLQCLFGLTQPSNVCVLAAAYAAQLCHRCGRCGPWPGPGEVQWQRISDAEEHTKVLARIGV